MPISDPIIQNMTSYELEFYEYSMIADDPAKLKKLTNSFYDPEFDQWLEDFDNGEDEDLSKYDDVDLQRPEEISDWEEVE